MDQVRQSSGLRLSFYSENVVEGGYAIFTGLCDDCQLVRRTW